MSFKKIVLKKPLIAKETLIGKGAIIIINRAKNNCIFGGMAKW